MRPIYFAPENYPRYVGSARGVPAYAPIGNQSAFAPLGHKDLREWRARWATPELAALFYAHPAPKAPAALVLLDKAVEAEPCSRRLQKQIVDADAAASRVGPRCCQLPGQSQWPPHGPWLG